MQPNSQAYLDTAHLLRRAAFGGMPDEIQAASQRGLRATTSALINYEQFPSTIDDDALIEKLKDALPEAARPLAETLLPIKLVQTWWTYRMLATNRPLEEKMTLFWHNHFTSKDGNGQGELMMGQNQLYRKYALGNFRTLTLAVARNPEMLRYLNGNQNYKAHPNENFARELMELFTCGRVDQNGNPNYTEDDIKNSAKAFSGWNESRLNFYYNPNQHDDTAKVFMGRTGSFNGDDIIDILCSLPATAHYVTRKLFRYFAYDDPEPDVMASLVDTYFNSGYEIKPIVEQILTSSAFYSEKARSGLIKPPAEFVCGSVHMLGLTPEFAPPIENLFGDDPNAPAPFVQFGGAGKPGGRLRRGAGALGSPVGRLVFLTNQMRNMGQDLLGPPTVKGWDGGTDWINTDTLQARGRFGAAMSAMPDLNLTSSSGGATSQTAALSTGGNVEQIVDNVLQTLGPLQVPPAVHETLVQFASTERNPDAAARAVLSLAMGTTEYQLA